MAKRSMKYTKKSISIDCRCYDDCVPETDVSSKYDDLVLLRKHSDDTWVEEHDTLYKVNGQMIKAIRYGTKPAFHSFYGAPTTDPVAISSFSPSAYTKFFKRVDDGIALWNVTDAGAVDNYQVATADKFVDGVTPECIIITLCGGGGGGGGGNWNTAAGGGGSGAAWCGVLNLKDNRLWKIVQGCPGAGGSLKSSGLTGDSTILYVSTNNGSSWTKIVEAGGGKGGSHGGAGGAGGTISYTNSYRNGIDYWELGRCNGAQGGTRSSNCTNNISFPCKSTNKTSDQKGVNIKTYSHSGGKRGDGTESGGGGAPSIFAEGTTGGGGRWNNANYWIIAALAIALKPLMFGICACNPLFTSAAYATIVLVGGTRKNERDGYAGSVGNGGSGAGNAKPQWGTDTSTGGHGGVGWFELYY